MLLVSEIERHSRGNLINGNFDKPILNFTINSKEITTDSFFIPLKGNTDGHDYIIDAIKNGISGFFIENNIEKEIAILEEALTINPDIIIIEVENCLESMKSLASYVRKKIDVPVIAITGSIGKTSMREILAIVLQEKYKVLVAKKNQNNQIGLPLTLLNYNDEDIVLLELGMNQRGEITFLSKLCRPTICLITNIGTAHIGNLGSIEEIYKEKLDIINGMDKGLLLLNYDDTRLKTTDIKNHKVIRYGLTYDNISNLIEEEEQINFEIEYQDNIYKIILNEAETHLINYALATIKIGLYLEMNIKDIIRGLGKYHHFQRRFEKIYLKDNILLIDDSYNASVESMKAGLNYFDKINRDSKNIVIGDMLELGSYSVELHKEIAKHIIRNNLYFENIYLVGTLSINTYDCLIANNYKNVYWYQSVDSIIKELTLEPNTTLYLKASNGLNFALLIDKLKEKYS